MEKTDVPVVILGVILVLSIIAGVVLWWIGKLDYEASAAPLILEKLAWFAENYFWAVIAIVGLIVILFVISLALDIRRRMMKKEHNIRVMREEEEKVWRR